MPGKRANSEGSITKRKDGLWEARISVEGGKHRVNLQKPFGIVIEACWW
jgi:hypothetical protein